MNIEPQWPLPATIVIPGAVYGRCMECFLSELIPPERYRQCAEGQEEETIILTDDEEAQARKAAQDAISVPFWRRREHAARQWDLPLARFVTRRVLGLAQFGPAFSLVRVNPRSAESWFDGLPKKATKPDRQSASICLCLPQTYDYCGWLAEGGDADLGRWIARAVEQRLWS